MTRRNMPNGGILTQEIDIVTKKYNIEVKEGTRIKGKQLEELVEKSKQEGKEAILFAPGINDKTVTSLENQFKGLKVIKSWKELGEKVKK